MGLSGSMGRRACAPRTQVKERKPDPLPPDVRARINERRWKKIRARAERMRPLILKVEVESYRRIVRGDST